MFSIIHYISAGRRLHESEKTVYMMGGEEECQPMLLAQRDMIKLERDYYREEAIKFGIMCLFIMFVFAIILPFLFKYGVI
jgi:hypothetical protein